MSYLDVPRLHFAGRFHADPSTIDNNPNDFDPDAPLSNDPNSPYYVLWNPNGSHNFGFDECTVRSAVKYDGSIVAAGDRLIGAKVLSSLDRLKYTAKLVDLDTDQQSVSQIWGLQLRISVPDPVNPNQELAGFSGVMPPTCFADMWTRVRGGGAAGIPWFSAVYHSVLQNVQWQNAEQSPVLAELQRISGSAVSIRFNVDSYQANSLQPNFTYGRVVGSIGPAATDEPTRFLGGRRLSVAPVGQAPSPKYGAAGAKWDARRRRLIFDFGNTVPTQKTGQTVPPEGWDVPPSRWGLYVDRQATPSPARRAAFTGPLQERGAIPAKGGGPEPRLATAAAAPAEPEVQVARDMQVKLATVEFTQDMYLNGAGVLDLAIDPALVDTMLHHPLVLVDETNPATPNQAVAEDKLGRYADVSLPFLRMNPGDEQSVLAMAFQFGRPKDGVDMELATIPQAPPGQPDPNNTPLGALSFPEKVTTKDGGTASINFRARNPDGARKERFLDGQVYFIGGPWMAWGNLMPLQSAAISVLVFDSFELPGQPNWEQHIKPIFTYYTRVYPYMKSILDLSDYQTVVSNIGPIEKVLNLKPEHPHHMPVLRDLSAGKLALINRWIELNMPLGPAMAQPLT